MLARWVRGALVARQMGTACIVYAHLALLFRNVARRAFGRRATATLLTAQVFLNIHYRFDAEPRVDGSLDAAAAAEAAAREWRSANKAGNGDDGDGAQIAVAPLEDDRRGGVAGDAAENNAASTERVADALGFSQTEFFDLMQRHRAKMLEWLEARSLVRSLSLGVACVASGSPRGTTTSHRPSWVNCGWRRTTR